MMRFCVPRCVPAWPYPGAFGSFGVRNKQGQYAAQLALADKEPEHCLMLAA
jgi:hypothetical protein